MNMKEHFREIAQDITDGYCGGWTCLPDGEISYAYEDAKACCELYRRKVEKNMKEKWYLYYTTHDSRCDSTIIIAKSYNDAKNRAEAAGMDGNVTWLCEADEWDIKLKASGEYHNGASVLTLSRDTAGYSVFAIDKYDNEIAAIKRAKRNATTVQDDAVDKEKFLSMFNVGSYYKISYTDDLIEGDKDTFCIIRFKEYLYDNTALFENIYDHRMGLVPDIKVDMFNIRNDDYTIVKIPYGGNIRE